MRRLNSSSARPDASGLHRVLLKPHDPFKQLQQAQTRQEETSASPGGSGEFKPGQPEDTADTEQGYPKTQWTRVSVCILAKERAESKDSHRRGQGAWEQQEVRQKDMD